MVLFVVLYKVIQTFGSVDKILNCDHSNESYRTLLSQRTFSYVVQGGYIFWVYGCNPKMWPFIMNFHDTSKHGSA